MSGNIFGLKQKINVANTEKEVLDLLQLSKTYVDASPETIRSWKNATIKRLHQLNSTKPSIENVETVLATAFSRLKSPIFDLVSI
jgi:hypothetical protein